MKKFFTFLLLLTSLFSFSQSTTVVISQAYSGGGTSSGPVTYQNDYVELHNISTITQDISLFSIQYGSATGNFGNTGSQKFIFPASTTIPAGGYLLIQLGSAGTAGAVLPVAPDFSTANASMGATAGKVALVNDSAGLNCGALATACTLPAANIIDLVSWGTANNAEGGVAVPALSKITGAVRKGSGCQDTDNNAADFDTIQNPVPRNSASPIFICSGSTSPTITAGTVVDFGNVIVGTNSTSQTFNISGSNLTGAPGNITITSPSTDFQVSNDNAVWGATAVIPYTSATLASTPVYVRFTPQTVGPKSGNVTISGGGIGTAVNVPVSGNGIVATGPTLTSTSSADFGNICVNTTAGPNSFTITGVNLTNADVTVGPLSGFTFSTTSGGTYSNSLNIPQPGGSFSQIIFIKFTPTVIASYSGNIPVNGGGVPAAINVPVSGAGVNSVPSLTTGSASAITFTSATLAGSISAMGCSAVIAYGIEYSLTSGFVPGTGVMVPSTNIMGSDFTSALSSLTPGTTYYYIAYATNGAGTGYGIEMSFVTGSSSTSTISATSPTAFGDVCINTVTGPNSFTITGTNLTTANVVVGGVTGYTFSTTSGGTYTNTLTITQPGGAFSQIIFVKFSPVAVSAYNGSIAISGGGAPAASIPVSGNGVNSAPAVITGTASAVLSTSATLAGSITLLGCSAVTSYGVEYSLVSGFTPGTGTLVTSTNLSGSDFTSALNSLIPGTTYYYIAFAVNAGGPGYGAQQSFITAAGSTATIATTSLTVFGPVCVNTTAGPESFTITGTNLSTGDIVIGPLNGYTFSTTSGGTYTNSISISQAGGAFTQTIYVQFTPTTSGLFDGNIPVTGGGTTGITVAATGSGSNSAILVITANIDTTTLTPYEVVARGAVSSVGCSPVTSYGIEYSSFNGFANGSGTKVESFNLSGNDFSSRLNGLIQSTTYYYKAYAINSAGISYGAQESFKTLPIPDGLIIYSTPVIRGSNLHYSLKGVKPGHYAARIFNHVGQLVFQKDMILQLNFIDDVFILPAKMPMGLYSLQIYNHEYKIQKTFMVQ